jgi:hypothetical protein
MLSKIKFVGGVNIPINLIPEKFHLHIKTCNNKLKINFCEFYKYTLYFCDYNDIIYGKEEHLKNYNDINYFVIIKDKKTSNICLEYRKNIEIPFQYKNNITVKSIESFEQNSIDIKYDIYDFVIKSIDYPNISNYNYNSNINNIKKVNINNNINVNDIKLHRCSLNYIQNNKIINMLHYTLNNELNNNRLYPINKKIFLGIGGEYYFYWSNISKKYDKYIGITNNDFILNDASLNSDFDMINSKNYKVDYKNNTQLFKLIYYKILHNIYIPNPNNYQNLNKSIKVYNYKIDIVINLFKIYDNIFRVVNLLIKLKLLDTLVIISCKDFDLNKINFKNNIKKHDICYFNNDTTLVKVYVLYF